jgi:hypothetical protein
MLIWMVNGRGWKRSTDATFSAATSAGVGTTIVHVLDLAAATAYTAVTPAEGAFMRLTGQIDWLDP